MENWECFECHGNEEIQAETDKGATLNLLLLEEDYEMWSHGSLDCIMCHEEAASSGFSTVPHKLKSETQDCQDCHGLFFNDINKAFDKDIHRIRQDSSFRCDSCHNPHEAGYIAGWEEKPSPQDWIATSNSICLDCHENEVVSAQGKLKPLIAAHADLSAWERHLKAVRCVDCHTPSSDFTNHSLQAVSDVVPCRTCHSQETLLVTKLYRPDVTEKREFMWLNKGLFNDQEIISRIKAAGGALPEKEMVAFDSKDWVFTNQPLADQMYLLGATQHKGIDLAFKGLLLITVLSVFVHLMIRLIIRPNNNRSSVQYLKTYLHKLSVRLWHWFNAVAVLVLIISGYSLHFSEDSEGIIDFGLAVRYHDVAGILLIISYLIFLGLNLSGGYFKNYLPKPRGSMKRMWNQAYYYGIGLFKGEPHPHHPDKTHKFNSLQKLTYSPLMFVVLPLLLISGILLLNPAWIPQELFGYSGKWVIVMSHYILAGLISLFLIIHLYLSTTGVRMGTLISSMITGYYVSEKSDGDSLE